MRRTGNPKAPANVRCNRSHPLSPANRKAKRQKSAALRQIRYNCLSPQEKYTRNSKKVQAKLLKQYPGLAEYVGA